MRLAPPIALSALALLLGPGSGAAQEAGGAPSPRRPHIVVIYVDDLGAGELGAYGQEHIKTPHIDALARRGMRFSQAYSGSPVCAPSRCSLLTAKHSGHATVRANWEAGGWGPDEPEGQFPLPADDVTLAERLGELDYRSGAFGKWGLGGPGSEGAPERQGFDHFHGYLCQRVAHNYYPTHLWRNGARVPIEGAEWFRAHQKLKEPLDSVDAYYEAYGDGAERYAPQLIADEMIGWMQERLEAEEPLFLYYASIIPHLALQVPREYVERYPEEWDTEPYLGQKSYLPHPSPRRAYAGMISFLDDQVGRIVAALDGAGVLDDTIIVFTSDNGATYVGGVDTEFFGSHDGRRGHKGQLWEGGIRVPLIASWPGRIEAGSRCDAPVSSVDLTATLFELLGEERRLEGAGLDGASFAGELLGEDDLPPRPHLYWEYAPRGMQAVRDGRWKLVRTGLKRGKPLLALFDLEADPAEANNLARSKPSVVERLSMIMDLEHRPSKDFPLPHVDVPVKK